MPLALPVFVPLGNYPIVLALAEPVAPILEWDVFFNTLLKKFRETHA